MNIEESCTYVVDLHSLSDPDDIKADNFGIWKHTGSHDKKFLWKMSNGEVMICQAGGKQYSLRRLHSIHPTNSDFRRMVAFITGYTCHFILQIILLFIHR